MARSASLLVSVVGLLVPVGTSALLPGAVPPPVRRGAPHRSPALLSVPLASGLSRRALLLAMPVLPALRPSSALAAATGGGFAGDDRATLGGGPPKLEKLAPLTKGEPSPEELRRLQLGYQRLQYLLDNWELETTVCIKGCKGKAENCGCIRDPIIVQEYMGYKSMNDPLFKAGSIMQRAATLVDDKNFDAYTETFEKWNLKADSGNAMAYVSSWGEANPGGGQDEIARYLKKSRDEVVESAQILKKILDYLELPPLPKA
jgi:hypothetical protein